MTTLITTVSGTGSPKPPEPHFTASIVVYLVIHVPIQSTVKKKSMKKETRTKEFSHCFSVTKHNYLHLLNTILEKHHIPKKFKSTEQHHYVCKIQVPPSK